PKKRRCCVTHVSEATLWRLIAPQPHRCDTMPAKLAPNPEFPRLFGSSTPNSVAILGPILSCRLPSRNTVLREKAAACRLEGPDGESGVWIWPSSTASQFLAKP